MKLNGEDFIKVVCNRLKDENKDVLLSDSVIINRIREMSDGEMWQVISFGDVQDWHNERI